MKKSCLEKIILKFQIQAPANQPGQFSLSWQIFLHWAAATLKGLVEFQNIFSRPLFTMENIGGGMGAPSKSTVGPIWFGCGLK